MKLSDIVLALLTVLIWGFNFVVIKLGLQGMPPLMFTALRFACAAVPMVFFVARPAVPWRLLAGFALFQFVLQFGLLFCGMKLGFSPGLASLAMQMQVFFTIGLAVIWQGERPAATQWVGALIALCGMGVVASHIEGHTTFVGFVLIIAAAFAWGCGNIFIKRIGKTDPMGLVVWGSLLAAPLLGIASLAIEGEVAVQAVTQLSWQSLAAVAYQAYPTTLIGFGIWSMLMRKYPAAIVAPFTLLVPVFGMLSAAWVLGEPLQNWKTLAGLIVLAGLAVNQFGARLVASFAQQR